MGWSPDLRARSLRTNRSFALGLVRDTAVAPGDSVLPGVHRRASSATCRPSGRRSCWHRRRQGRARRTTYRKLASERRVDGVILTDLRAADERLALVAALGLAAVTVGQPDIDSPFPAVPVDAVAGVEAMVDHLVGLGHRVARARGRLDRHPPRTSPASRRSSARVRHAASPAGSSRRTPARARAARRREAHRRSRDRARRRSRTRTTGWRWPASGWRSGAGLSDSARPLDRGVRRQRHRPVRLPVADVGRDGRRGVGRAGGAHAARRDRRDRPRRHRRSRPPVWWRASLLRSRRSRHGLDRSSLAGQPGRMGMRRMPRPFGKEDDHAKNHQDRRTRRRGSADHDGLQRRRRRRRRQRRRPRRPRATSPSGTRTTRPRSRGASRWSRRGTPTTPRSRSRRRRSLRATAAKRSSRPRSPRATHRA